VWHFIHYAYDHLVNLGVYKDVLAAVVGAVAARLIARIPLKRHQKNQKRIIDLLNTKTPGGLSDVVSELTVIKDQQDEAAKTAQGESS
jgi:hypothetical protein